MNYVPFPKKKTARRSKTKRNSKSQGESIPKVLPKKTLRNKLYHIRRTLSKEGFTRKELGIIMSVVATTIGGGLAYRYGLFSSKQGSTSDTDDQAVFSMFEKLQDKGVIQNLF